jgi:hypothetical protein
MSSFFLLAILPPVWLVSSGNSSSSLDSLLWQFLSSLASLLWQFFLQSGKSPLAILPLVWLVSSDVGSCFLKVALSSCLLFVCWYTSFTVRLFTRHRHRALTVRLHGDRQHVFHSEISRCATLLLLIAMRRRLVCGNSTSRFHRSRHNTVNFVTFFRYDLLPSDVVALVGILSALYRLCSLQVSNDSLHLTHVHVSWICHSLAQN